ncbi:MAG: hypothetical protein JOZ62_23785, partial [Acidobacteriaceae bacterium]|nr:hypothetical protein [Acidobacteriaceae bacterium]
MHVRKPTAIAAGLGLAFLLLQPLAAQRSSSTGSSSSSDGSVSQSATKPGTSETSVPIETANRADVPAPAKKDDRTPIRVQVNEVVVPVTVTDEKGRFVSDLDQKDFQIFENNKPQQIRFFTRERSQPVVIGFLLDLSTASRIHWQ